MNTHAWISHCSVVKIHWIANVGVRAVGNMKTVHRILLAALVAFQTLCVHGFGNDGHKIVAAIAETYLFEGTKAEIRSLLGSASLATASTWADEIRGNPQYFFAKPLHYVNVPKSATKVDDARDCANDACVTAAINYYAAILSDRDRSPSERAEALRFVVHFVGDVHQPLHVSYKEDSGGNGVHVTWLGKTGWSLHSVWDSALISKRKGSSGWENLARDLRSTITDSLQREFSRLADPVDWANESLGLTRAVYSNLPASRRLTQTYYSENIGTVEKQLQRAGVRLANLLNGRLSVTSHAVAGVAVQDAALSICSFNIQFLGSSRERDHVALADIVKTNDIVVVQELVAPPYPGRFPNGDPFKPDPESALFFDAMQRNGFEFVLSEEDTGRSATIHSNGNATEWFVTFYKPTRVDVANDLPHGFLSSDRSANPNFDRVPYAFSFRSKNRNADFVLISVHLRPNAGTADRARRVQELAGIAQWIHSNDQVEKDFIILGDMNIEDQRDLSNAMPRGFDSLNSALLPTNTNVRSPKPYDHVMFVPTFTKEIDRTFGLAIVRLVERMKDYWSRPEAYPGDEPYDHDAFRKYFSDHNPIVFVLKTEATDDD